MPHTPNRLAASIARALAVAVLGCAARAHADPVFDYSAGVMLEHSDNINLSATDPVSQNVLIPTLSVRANSKGSAVEARAAGTFEYRDYLGGAFGDEFRSQVSGIVDWHISPQRLDWVVEDYLGLQPINALESNAPSNLQQTNVFSTGPTLQARFSEAWRGALDLRYTNSHADTSTEFNSDRYSAAGHALYELDANSTLSASAADTSVRYDEAASRRFNYDRNDVYGSYQRTTRQFNMLAALGYSWVDLNRLGKHTGPLFRANATWTPSTHTSIGVTLQREFSDASQDLIVDPSRIGNTGIGTGLNGAVITPQVYVEKYVGLNFSHAEERFRVGVAPFVRQRNYIEGDFPDERSRGAYVDGAYFLNSAWSLGAFVGDERRRYTEIGRTDDDLRYGLSLSWRNARHWLWSLSATRTRRDSDAELSSYTENAIFLSLTYNR